MNPHYLNVPGTEWEYKETDRNTGRQARKIFAVPLFLNPNDAADCNRDGEIIVCNGNGTQRGDHVFLGPPTPDMEPLDAEAEAISDAERPKWQHPIEGLPVNGDYSQSLLATLEKQLASLMKDRPIEPAPAVSMAGVDSKAFALLQNQVSELMTKNAQLQAQVAERPARRV